MMKISASSRTIFADEEFEDEEVYTLDDWTNDLESIAHRRGYDLQHNVDQVSMDNPTALELKLSPQNDMMPDIEVSVVIEQERSIQYLCLKVNLVRFPNLMDEDMQYHDSWTYHIENWKVAGELADAFSQEIFRL